MTGKEPADQIIAHVAGQDRELAASETRLMLAPLGSSVATTAAVLVVAAAPGPHVTATLIACVVATVIPTAITAGFAALLRLYWLSLYARLVRAGVRHVQGVDDVRDLMQRLNDAPMGHQK